MCHAAQRQTPAATQRQSGGIKVEGLWIGIHARPPLQPITRPRDASNRVWTHAGCLPSRHRSGLDESAGLDTHVLQRKTLKTGGVLDIPPELLQPVVNYTCKPQPSRIGYSASMELKGIACTLTLPPASTPKTVFRHAGYLRRQPPAH